MAEKGAVLWSDQVHDSTVRTRHNQTTDTRQLHPLFIDHHLLLCDKAVGHKLHKSASGVLPPPPAPSENKTTPVNGIQEALRRPFWGGKAQRNPTTRKPQEKVNLQPKIRAHHSTKKPCGQMPHCRRGRTQKPPLSGDSTGMQGCIGKGGTPRTLQGAQPTRTVSLTASASLNGICNR